MLINLAVQDNVSTTKGRQLRMMRFSGLNTDQLVSRALPNHLLTNPIASFQCLRQEMGAGVPAPG